MTEVLFYHLTSSPLERTLPQLLERSLERGWKVVLQSPDPARLEHFDQYLWSYSKEGFLPHGLAGQGHDADQPVLLTTKDDAPNGAELLMLIDGARREPAEITGFERVCLFFDGNDEAAVATAREDWKAVKAADLAAKYWAQEDGRWVQKA